MPYQHSKHLEQVAPEQTQARSGASVGLEQLATQPVAASDAPAPAMSAPSSQPDRLQLSPDDLFALKHVRSASLAPDARSIAYAVSRTDDSERVEIWIVDLATGEKRGLQYPGLAQAPCWSPDGSHIAFVADGRLRVANAQSLAI